MRKLLAGLALLLLSSLPSGSVVLLAPTSNAPAFSTPFQSASVCSGGSGGVNSCTATGINLPTTTAKLFLNLNQCGDINCNPTAPPNITSITGANIAGCVQKKRAVSGNTEVQMCNVTSVNSNASVTINYSAGSFYTNVGAVVVDGLIADENISNTSNTTSGNMAVSTNGPTTQANDFVYSFMSTGSGSPVTAGSGQTAFYATVAPGGWGNVAQYTINNTVGTQNAQAVPNDSAGGDGIIVAFKATRPAITGITLSNGNSFTIPATAGSTIDTISALCGAGPCAGATFALVTQAGCTSTNNGSFAVSGASLNIGGTTINDTSPRTICLQASLSGSPSFRQSFTLTGSNVTGIACDQGGTFPGAVPPPAAQPGVAFNTCALYAKFSQSQYSNNANWLGPCGASGIYSSWGFQAWPSGSIPCGRAAQVNDGGTTAMQLTFNTSDLSNAPQGIMELHWPNATGNGQALPLEYFANIKFRIDNTTLFSGNWTSAAGPVDWWMTNDRSDATYPGWIEIDYLETFGTHATGWGGGLIEWNNGCSGGSCQFGPVTGYTISDLSQYHSISTLVTSDNTSTVAKCTWVDGVAQGCGTMGSFSFPATFNNPNLYEIAFWWGVGRASPGSPPTPNVPMIAYIEEIEVFACSGYKTQGHCGSTVITSQSNFTPP